jgi:hypothetical protein
MLSAMRRESLTDVPSLECGDQMDRHEFLRRALLRLDMPAALALDRAAVLAALERQSDT